MSLDKKLGASFLNAKDKIKIKTVHIELDDAEFDLKVRVPFKREMEAIIEKISSPSSEVTGAIFDRITATLRKSIDDGGDEFLTAINAEKPVLVVTESDIVLDGNSMRQMAVLTAMWETKVEEYFHLLQSETGVPIDETYAEILEQFPESVVRFIVERIEQTIKPDYNTAKKN
jgi:hypothetical protein